MSALILWVGGGLALLILVVGVVVTVTGERSLVDERVENYLQQTQQPLEFGSSEDDGEKKAATPLTDLINSLVTGSSFGERIARMLARADLKLKPGEFIALTFISTVVTAFVSYTFGGGRDAGVLGWLFGIIGLGVGAYLPRLFVARQQGQRLKRFNDQLPDMLNLMVNGLRAGFSTMQAMEAVSKELPPPISDEFRRVVQEMQLGVPMERALDNLMRRIPSDDVDLVVTAVNVQREVGGNLSEILDTISYTIRERIRIKGEIKTLTAQVVYSGRFLSLLPIILSFILWALNRNYMMQFFLEPKLCGIGLLVLAGIMIVIGYTVMAKIADIEV